jgi:hypothetical protein
MSKIKPIVIIGAPRSGTTFLKEALSFHKEIWHLPSESHHILEGPLHPRNFSNTSNRPDKEFDLDLMEVDAIRSQFFRQAVNLSIIPFGKSVVSSSRKHRFSRKLSIVIFGLLSKFSKGESIIFLEKTPKNSVRIEAITRIFPEAKYIFLKRDPVDNIFSLFRGWEEKTGFFYKVLNKGRPRFANSGYKFSELANFGITDSYWRFVLPPQWQAEKFHDLLDIVIFQYKKSNELAEEDARRFINPENIFKIDYEKLKSDTELSVKEILEFCGLDYDKYDFGSLKNIPKINTSGARASIEREEISRRYHQGERG